jgi:hypothetical protein
MQSTNHAIIACAGAGKTFTICNRALNSDASSLLISYTERGKKAIIDEITNNCLGIFPSRITVETWFEFLLRDIIKPYQVDFFQTFIEAGSTQKPPINYVRSIDFTTTHKINFKKKGTFHYYFNGHDIKHNETILLALKIISINPSSVLTRLHQLYKNIFIDECQDLAGSDVELIKILLKSKISVCLVGDPKQSIFSTHNSKGKNKNRTGQSIETFFEEMENNDLITISKMQQSRRFGKKIGDFANTVFPNKNSLVGVFHDRRPHQGVFLLSPKDLPKYIKSFHPVFLVYNKRSRKLVPQDQVIINFGDCKGSTFDDVVIVCNKTFEEFLKGKPLSSPAKYYIASTRARYSIGILVSNLQESELTNKISSLLSK